MLFSVCMATRLGLSRRSDSAARGIPWQVDLRRSTRSIRSHVLPGDLFLWPTTRSYTREPSAEFHTLGSPPLLAAVLEQLCRTALGRAEPGEFTLRAFLAGRIDLTQAEAVLGVIDARDRDELDAALDQLAGGLSRPLHQLRDELLGVLAELEAGLDFVEEDIEFIGRELSRGRVAIAAELSATLAQQTVSRDVTPAKCRKSCSSARPTPARAACSTHWSSGSAATDDRRIRHRVAEPGATRDYVGAAIRFDGVACEIIDTAGIDDSRPPTSPIDHAAQQSTADRSSEWRIASSAADRRRLD